MPTVKKKLDSPVIGAIGASTPPSVAQRRRGRKPRHEYALRPYTVYQDPKTGGHYVRFTDPVTKTRVRRPLRRDGAGQTATKIAAEAERLAAKIWQERLTKAGRVAAGVEPEREVRVRALIPGFLAHLRGRDITDTAKRDYGRHIQRWVKHTSFANIDDVRHVDGPVLQRLAAQLLKVTRKSKRTRNREEPFSRKMVRTHLVTLAAFFRWVSKHHGVSMANPVTTSGILADFPKGGRGDDHYYLPEEVDALLRTVDAWRYTARSLGNREIAYTLAYTGARVGEVLSLRVNAVNFATNTLTLPNAKRSAKDRASGARKTRTITMWPRLRSVLLAYIRRHNLQGTDPLFPRFVPASARGSAPREPRTTGPYEWLEAVCAAAGVPYRGGHHVWRHTVVSVRSRMHKRLPVLGQPGIYAIAPVSIEDVQAEVGHVEGSTVTARVYKHASMHLPPLAVIELDWGLLAEASRRHVEEVRARFGEAFHETDAQGMRVLASPALQAQVGAPPVFK